MVVDRQCTEEKTFIFQMLFSYPSAHATFVQQQQPNFNATSMTLHQCWVDVVKPMVPIGVIFQSHLFREIFATLIVVVVVLLFYVHGKHLRSCRDGQLT